jgi:Ca-activated chloride channel family protein
MSGIELFHFLRPVWLIAIPVIAALWWYGRWRASAVDGSGQLVASHLRAALTVNRDQRDRFRPVDLAALLGLAVVLAASGPTWSRQPSPWFAESAPLVVAIEVSDSMRASDVAPTRLDRARFKLLDLIEARTGSRTAVIAYADSAHIVLPPSSDVDVIKPLLESLDPAIMPLPGSNAADALPLALRLLGDNAAIGTVLFVNDGFDALDIPVLAGFEATAGNPSLVALTVGTDEGGVALYPDGSAVTDAEGNRLDTAIDAAVLARVEAEAGVPVLRMTSDDADVRRLLRAITSNLMQADDPDAQWRDEGWWFLWPAGLFGLLWFRRGWTMRW